MPIAISGKVRKGLLLGQMRTRSNELSCSGFDPGRVKSRSLL
jgi:hypothetical protein